MTGLPRGFVASDPYVGGGEASITIPAVAAVAHVITAINASIWGSTGHISTIFDLLIMESGVDVDLLGSMLVPGVDSNEKDSTSWTGEMSFHPGTAVTIQINFRAGSTTDIIGWLDIAGYDI